jgi:DNA polymerase I-like protein with 3'-5' exonuclease and polymerase domains
MGVTELEARAAIEDFKRSLPGVERWKSALVKDARERTPPHVRTIAGRCRFLPSLNATGAGGENRAADERKAINTACQGSAADIVKRVMIELHAKLTSGGGADDDDEWAPLREVDACEMVLQVHDELLFEVDERKVDVAVRAIRGVMERAREVHDMKVPLPVRVSVGDDWGRLREVNG